MGIKFRALVGPLITISISTTAFTLLSRVMYKKSISPKFELDNIEGKIFVITGGCRGNFKNCLIAIRLIGIGDDIS
ncbi:MAG: hypothetical protein MHMPM18_002368 [Marteilia pararefringens]